MKAKKVKKSTAIPGTVVQEADSSCDNSTGLINTKVSRRTFIKGSVGAAAVVGVAAAVIGSEGTLQAVTSSPQTSASTDPFASQLITLNVNGTDYPVSVEPRDMLVNVIRDNLGLTGTKRPCNRQECGGCTVLMDGVPVNSCNYIALRAQGKKILTTEGGVASTVKGAPAPDTVIAALHAAFVQEDGGQCAYCSPGQIMAAAGLLKQNTSPTVDEIKVAQSGNLCRCGNYPNIIRSVQAAAKTLGGA